MRKKLILVIGCAFLLVGCRLYQHSVHKNFTYHERYPCDSSCKKIKGDGAYHNLGEFLCFYNDGKFLYEAGWTKFWGHYVMKNDSILIQYFFLDGGSGFFYRNTIEMAARVTNDSIFVYKQKCDWCDRKIGGFPNGEVNYNPPKVYTFKKTDNKPDSTKSFFYDKKWYNDGLKKRRSNEQ
jgi:hypothetical protein